MIKKEFLEDKVEMYKTIPPILDYLRQLIKDFGDHPNFPKEIIEYEAWLTNQKKLHIQKRNLK